MRKSTSTLGTGAAAVIVATITMLAVGFFFSAVQPAYELMVLDMVRSEPVPAEQAVAVLFWPALAFVLFSTVVTFGIGGYIAGRMAGFPASIFALLAVQIPLVLTWSVIFLEPTASLLRPAMVSIFGTASAVVFSTYGAQKVA